MELIHKQTRLRVIGFNKVMKEAGLKPGFGFEDIGKQADGTGVIFDKCGHFAYIPEGYEIVDNDSESGVKSPLMTGTPPKVGGLTKEDITALQEELIHLQIQLNISRRDNAAYLATISCYNTLISSLIKTGGLSASNRELIKFFYAQKGVTK